MGRIDYKTGLTLARTLTTGGLSPPWGRTAFISGVALRVRGA